MTRGQKNLLIVWHDSHLTGIKILDEQHRAYVAIVNSLHYTLSSRQEETGHQPASRPTFLQPIYEIVISYSKIHFKTEIELLRLSHYPQLHQHQAQHDQWIIRGEQIYHNCMKEGGDPELLLVFLKELWQKHTLQNDMAYSEHLINYFQSDHRVIKKHR